MSPPAGEAAGAAPWMRSFVEPLACLAPLPPDGRIARLDAWARDRGLRSGSGRRLRFVPDDAPGGARVPYERRVHDEGEVAVRTGAPGHRHDLYNALMWLAWPRSKARLNALHVAAAGAPEAPRGRVRDALTLLDENGAVWLSTDPSLDAALRAFDWRTLFVLRRAEVAGRVGLRVFGHALLEKLDAPYKAITAHAWLLPLPPDASDAEVDAALAARLDATPLQPDALSPLPVLGFPGWCEANRDPAFYNDPQVFRPGRRRAADDPAGRVG